MKQVLLNLGSGETTLADVPCPQESRGHVLIRSVNSLVSVGTERMLAGFGQASYVEKARQQPDKVKMVLNKVKTDGLASTVETIRGKLDQPLALGYSNAGVVIEVGEDVDDVQVGDRVVSNGNHAEVVRVPKNLCAKIPDAVDDESASFTVLGAIALQGIRLANPTLGESYVVTGLGVIGLLTLQLLRANGCRVLGIDYDSTKCALAKQYGAEAVDLSKGEDPLKVALAFSRGRGVDGVLITASTKSNEPVHQAAQMCRKRGRIVLVGVAGLALSRDDFYKKELQFQVSCSYGPGRYDPAYEEQGTDYPVGYVRWTEQRNFEAVLDMMANGSLDVKPLVTHRYAIDNALEAYKRLEDAAVLGIVFKYPEKPENVLRSPSVLLPQVNKAGFQKASSIPRVGFIGAGNYASRTLIPAFRDGGALLDTLVTSGGVSGIHHGAKNDFKNASTELNDLWNNIDINTVAIVTRHNAHAGQVVDALRAKKNVFVEKPLALRLAELESIDEAYRKAQVNGRCRLMVGFNRRFAPHIVKMKELLGAHRAPKVVVITINAGAIPAEHWVQDAKTGGGRVIGEGCHFIDLVRFLVGHPINGHHSMKMGNAPGIEVRSDKVTINLSFEDGSFSAIHYLANGGSVFPKERIEVFCDDAVLQMDNYRTLRGYGWSGFKKMKLIRQDKGQRACARAFIESICDGEEAPIPYEEVMESSRISIEIAEHLV